LLRASHTTPHTPGYQPIGVQHGHSYPKKHRKVSD